MLACTIDNEPIENAGLDAAIATSLPYLLHFHCGPHTLELLLTDLGKAMPELDQEITQAQNLAFSFKNRKDHMRPLIQLQKATGKVCPLTVLVPGNTRKRWK